MAQDGDFFNSYKAVSNKLKKRFMKKPNYSEASDDFNQLAKSLSSEGLNAYAGFCCQAAARCEQALGNTSGEIHHSINASKNFLKAHKKMECLHCPNGNEHLISSLSCCDAVIKLCEAKNMPVEAASLCWEFGEWLENNQQFDRATRQFLHCTELCSTNSLQLILCYKKLISLHLKLHDYRTALNFGTKMLEACHLQLKSSAQASGMFPNLLSDCETTVVLLIMLLNPHPLKIKEHHSAILQKYTWQDDYADDADGLVPYMDEDLFILMQSVVIACSGKDITPLRFLKKELSDYVSVEQATLLERIIKNCEHPMGMGF